MVLLDERQRERLLEVAEQSMVYGLDFERPPAVDPAAEPEALREKGASFVQRLRRRLPQRALPPA